MKLKSGIFRVDRRQKTPAAGLLLVAQPFFTDEYFHRSVICIIENDEVHGTMGLVLNNCSSLKLNDLFPELKELPEIPLFFGGPVSSDQLYYVHVWESIPGAIEIVPRTVYRRRFRNGERLFETDGRSRFHTVLHRL